jgi:serine protease
MRRLRIGVLWLPVVIISAMLLVPLQAEGTAAAVLHVPQDHPTIQAAVNAAAPGDTVQVSPGTYVELVDTLGKEITVESTDGPATTIIDGNHAGTVVTINAISGQTPVLRGFTVRNAGGFSAIETGGGPALIEGNRVTGNTTCSSTIEAAFSAATIRNNVISGNRRTCSGGVGGGGVSVRGAGTVTVTGNLITDNQSSSDGGGIALFAAGSPVVSNNVISNNSTPSFGGGGGISLVNESSALVVNNIIVGNRSNRGGGLYSFQPIIMMNNTIADNDGSAVFMEVFDVRTRFVNNVLVSSGIQATLHCGDFNPPNPPVIEHNDVFNSGSGPRYSGICTDQTGLNGNISADPLFVGPGDYHITPGSPAIDSGQNAGAPTTDFDGDQRPLDGNGDGVSAVDMGADEISVRDTSPPTITCAATPAQLSPANHGLRTVHADISAGDDSGTVAVTLTSVTSSQPDSGLGGGDRPNDIQGWTTGTDDRDGLLRAERFQTARVYTLSYRAADPAGNTATCRTTVIVP